MPRLSKISRSFLSHKATLPLFRGGVLFPKETGSPRARSLPQAFPPLSTLGAVLCACSKLGLGPKPTLTRDEYSRGHLGFWGEAMDHRVLGRTGLGVSRVGFGCGVVGGLMISGEHDERVHAVAVAEALSRRRSRAGIQGWGR